MNQESATVETLMKRGYLYLEDKDWKNAQDYFNKSLDIDPENAKAYIGMLLAELHIENEEGIVNSSSSFADNLNYQKALKFAEGSYKQIVENYNLENIWYRAELIVSNAKTEEDYLQAADLFDSIAGYKNASERASTCRQQATDTRLETTYQNAMSLLSGLTSFDVKRAEKLFEEIPDYKDSATKIEECKTKFLQLEQEEKQKHKKKVKRIIITCCAVFAILLSGYLSKVNENERLADKIHDNFLGKTFGAEVTRTHDYGIKETNEEYFKFKDDGTVYYCMSYDIRHSLLDPVSDYIDFTYNNFDIDVTFGGTIYIKVGLTGDKYEVEVDDQNNPRYIKYKMNNPYGDEVNLYQW